MNYFLRQETVYTKNQQPHIGIGIFKRPDGSVTPTLIIWVPNEMGLGYSIKLAHQLLNVLNEKLH